MGPAKFIQTGQPQQMIYFKDTGCQTNVPVARSGSRLLAHFY